MVKSNYLNFLILLLLTFELVGCSNSSTRLVERGPAAKKNNEFISSIKRLYILRNKVKSIALDTAYTRAGRGDTAPAYNEAKNLRILGFNGQIYLYLNDKNAHRVMKELSLDYRLKCNDPATAITIEDNIKVVRNFDEYPKLSQPKVDLGFRFALRPSELRVNGSIKNANMSFFSGVYNLSRIPTSNGVKNKIIYNEESVLLPDVGYNGEDLGSYSNHYAHELSKLDEYSALRSFKNALILDNRKYIKILEAAKLDDNIGQDYIELLKARNEKLLSFFANEDKVQKNLATAYGFGLPDTWQDFKLYVDAISKQKVDRSQGTILFSPSIFSDESQERLTGLFKESNKKLRFINILEGKSIPKNTAADEIVVALVGNLPHSTFNQIQNISTLPNLVAGDNALSDSVSLGKPFFMTRVDWNKPSMYGLRDFLLKVIEEGDHSERVKEYIYDIYRGYKQDFSPYMSLNSAHKNELKLVFKKASEVAVKHNLVLNVITLADHIKESAETLIESTSKYLPKITGRHFQALDEHELYFKDLRVSEFMRNEQERNIKHIYRKGVFDSELPKPYQADEKAIFKLPYMLVPVDTKEISNLKIDDLDSKVEKFYYVTQFGKKYLRYPIHPLAYNKFHDEFGGKFRFVSQKDSNIYAQPTASERSLAISAPTDPNNFHHQVKVSLPFEINNTNRKLKNKEVKRSVFYTSYINDNYQNSIRVDDFFNESMGAYPNSNQELGGFLVRQYNKNFFDSKIITTSYFSLLAENPVTGEPWFFEFMTPLERKNPYKWLEKFILKPLADVVVEDFVKKSIFFEIHSQNGLTRVDLVNKRIVPEVIYRDFGGISLDIAGLFQRGEFDKIPLKNFKEFKFFRDRSQYEVMNKDFIKKQVSDLFAIMMAKHGLVSKQEREEMKELAQVYLKKRIFKTISPDRRFNKNISWDEIGEMVREYHRGQMISIDTNYKVRPYLSNTDNKFTLFSNINEDSSRPYEVISSKKYANAPSFVIDKDGKFIGYIAPFEKRYKSISCPKRRINYLIKNR